MTYQNKFVVAIKANNKILRENDSTVMVPFGEEYKIVLKNLNTIRAQAKVEIDGEDATGWLILQPNEKLELERFIRNGNLERGNKFRFIERTSKIENHRGIGFEDGIVKVTYKFEKKYSYIPPTKIIHEHIYPNTWLGGPASWPYQTVAWGASNGNFQCGQYNTVYTNTTPSGSVGSVGAVDSTVYAMNCSLGESPIKSAPIMNQMNLCRSATIEENTVGITVPGSESTQQFYQTSYDFACEDSEIIVLKLIGKTKNAKVAQPVTVDYKPTCTTCGRTNRATNKFCSECGTHLLIF